MNFWSLLTLFGEIHLHCVLMEMSHQPYYTRHFDSFFEHFAFLILSDLIIPFHMILCKYENSFNVSQQHI